MRMVLRTKPCPVAPGLQLIHNPPCQALAVPLVCRAEQMIKLESPTECLTTVDKQLYTHN